MNDDVSAPLQGLNQVRRSNRVVHDQWDAIFVRNTGNSLDVENVVLRIRNRFAKESLRVRTNGVLPLLKVVGVINEGHFDAELWQRVVEQVVRAAIQAGAGHNVVADLRQVQDGQRFGSLTAANQQSGNSTFEGGDALFNDSLGWIHDAGVDVAEFGQAE